MAYPENYSATNEQLVTESKNKLIKNTYMLLSMTLAFSAVCAYAAMAAGISPLASIVMWVAAIVVLFVINKTANSGWGLMWTFVFTGLMGASLGPTLLYYLQLPSGPGIVLQALVATAAVFLGLTSYALVTKKDFSFMGGFLFMGLIVVVLASLANLFFHIEAMSLMISAAVVVIMSGYILFDTSRMVNGGETNYIHAAVAQYLNILNLFLALLRLIAAFSDN